MAVADVRASAASPPNARQVARQSAGRMPLPDARQVGRQRSVEVALRLPLRHRRQQAGERRLAIAREVGLEQVVERHHRLQTLLRDDRNPARTAGACRGRGAVLAPCASARRIASKPDQSLDERRRLAPEVGHRARLRLTVGERPERLMGQRQPLVRDFESACSSEPLSSAYDRLVGQLRQREPDAHERVVPGQSLRVADEVELAPRREDLGLVQLPHAAAGGSRSSAASRMPFTALRAASLAASIVARSV